MGTWPPGAEGEEARPGQVQVRTGGAGAEGRGLRSHLGALSGPRGLRAAARGPGLLCASPRTLGVSGVSSVLGVSGVSSVLPGARPGAESGIRDAPAFCLFPEVWAEVFPLTDRSEALA